jgi:hypothetical protein
MIHMYINFNNSLHNKFSLLCENSSHIARNPQQEHKERAQNSPLLLEGANGGVGIPGGLLNIVGKFLTPSGPPTLPPTFCICGTTMKKCQKELHLTANTKLAYSK